MGGREVLVHCELQTTDSTELAMPRRMASYMGHCIAEYDLPLLSHVLYLRPEAGRAIQGTIFKRMLGMRWSSVTR